MREETLRAFITKQPNAESLLEAHQRNVEVLRALSECRRWTTRGMPLLVKAAGFVKSNNEVSATDLTILETWNTPEEFYEGLSAVGDVVIQSATNVTDVPFVGSRMIAESCVKQIEEERARHIAKLTASDISTQVWLKSLRGPLVLEAVAKQDTTILWDPEARQKVFFDEATVRTPLEAEVVVYAHWQTSHETVPARVQRSVELLEDACENPADAADETDVGVADASSKMQPCFMMSTFTLKCDFSLKKGLCGEFTLDSVLFE
jgi:hypothetical protein